MSIESSSKLTSLPAFDALLQSEEFDRINGDIELASRKTRGSLIVSGLAGSARALFVAALWKKTGRRIVFLTRSNKEAEEFQSDVEFFYAAIRDDASRQPGEDSAEYQSPIVTIPAPENDPYDGTSPHAAVQEQRALALYRLSPDSRAADGAAPSGPDIVILPLAALIERTPPPSLLKSSGLSLKVGEDLPLELIVDLLISSGYTRQEPVGSVGEFSSRGGILDVFSPAQNAPLRIEFFGDTVESIREFDPDTQRSVGRTTEASIVPMRDLAVRREEFIKWSGAAGQRWSEDRFRRDLQHRVAHAERGEEFPGWEYLLPLTRPLGSSLFEYLRGSIMVIDEPADIEKGLTDMFAYFARRYAEAEDAGELALPPETLFLKSEELQAGFDSLPRIDLRLLGRTAAAIDDRFHVESLILPELAYGMAGPAPAAKARFFLFTVQDSTAEFSMISQSARRYQGRVQELADDLNSHTGETFLFVLPSLGLGERTVEMLRDYDLNAALLPSLAEAHRRQNETSAYIATVGRLSNGFTLPTIGLNVLTDADIFGDSERLARQRISGPRVRKQRSVEAFLSDLGELKIGDYVVHVDHGIGQFQGLQQIPVAAGSAVFKVAEGIGGPPAMREFMLLTYAEGARLFVPVERLDLIQRFSAGENTKPTLDRLGGVGWQKTKSRVKKAMRDMAEELLKLYAERKLVGGFAFGADTPWQKEFEDAFEYQLTPDQESAIEDLKGDMQKPEPMDRLLVGDVGYGKTEVAMRGAFKAIMEGKQVAVLAPTTVLVYQHYKTFQQRFGPFPVRIEMLSRFRSPKQQKEIVSAVEAGQLEIVIGTHRLLSKDLRFKDLGLLIVDEEQRFGVAHKERIKQLRKKVDVIAMSATPIPRTLNMSLAGLRDMSVIETPPHDRLSIQTQVVQFSEAVIRSAVELELQRGGQIFFVHNRVETIFPIAELIARLVPNARITVGHGQMGEKELEAAMLKFINHEVDLLVSTTIIENGIDIPLANTIIINRADAYGLSQLYQLRGRVGRSSRRAYAYLLIPSEDSLTDIARRRLAAIREFSDLGAGFRIAALDLELRGAGNLLGSQQSGHIEQIGFDLYTRMLERSVKELRGEQVEDETSAVVNLGVDIRISEDYIRDMSQRLRVYKRISSATSETALQDIRGEIEDRYGPVPDTVENLLEYARLRRDATRIGILSIDREGGKLAVKFSEGAQIDTEKLVALMSSGDATFTPAGVLRVQLKSDSDPAVLGEVHDLIEHLR